MTGGSGELLVRAEQFTAAHAEPGNAWRMEARSLIIELAAEVARLGGSRSDSGGDADVASPRDVIRPAISHGIVDGSWETSGSDITAAADGALKALDQAGYAVVSHVWVAQLELEDGIGYVSVHTTRDGAGGELVRWAQANGIEIDEYDSSFGSAILDDNPDVVSYGVSYVPVQR